MAGSSLFLLIDDIATLLDDVALMTKVAAKKTAGVLGDDLALNAKQVTGVTADRELPVVWAVAKGSLRNKAILVPAALAISAFAPWAIGPLLIAGGAYLCYEGVEKLAHRASDGPEDVAAAAARLAAVELAAEDRVGFEREKVKGAIRTDFILSAEIIVITLGTIAAATFAERVGVLVGVALLMTVGVYGLVAAIVKMDDVGLWLLRRGGALGIPGRLLVAAAPKLMRFLSWAGTLAMFLVGGSIVVHNVALLQHTVGALADAAGPARGALNLLLEGAAGVVLGALVLLCVTLVKRVRGRGCAHPA